MGILQPLNKIATLIPKQKYPSFMQHFLLTDTVLPIERMTYLAARIYSPKRVNVLFSVLLFFSFN